MTVRRLRVIAGPNGSGKSSVFPRIQDHVHTGHYLNPDELALRFHREGLFDLTHFNLTPEPDALRHYLHRNRAFVHKAEQAGEPITLHLRGKHLVVESRERTGYTASLAAGFLREQFVASGQSFSFESVLSDPSKLMEIEAAKEAGYRIYLYFVCTENADINVARVANRALLGGHSVPEARIRERYQRTLGNLPQAFLLSDRAYLFDNSGEAMVLVLEADGHHLHVRSDALPSWVEDHLLIPLNLPRG